MCKARCWCHCLLIKFIQCSTPYTYLSPYSSQHLSRYVYFVSGSLLFSIARLNGLNQSLNWSKNVEILSKRPPGIHFQDITSSYRECIKERERNPTRPRRYWWNIATIYLRGAINGAITTALILDPLSFVKTKIREKSFLVLFFHPYLVRFDKAR